MGFEGVPEDVKQKILSGDAAGLSNAGKRGGKKSAFLQSMSPDERDQYDKQKTIVKRRAVAQELRKQIQSEQAFRQEQKNWKKGIHSTEQSSTISSMEKEQPQFDTPEIDPALLAEAKAYSEQMGVEEFKKGEIERLMEVYTRTGKDEEGNDISDLSEEQKMQRIIESAGKYATAMSEMQKRMRE